MAIYLAFVRTGQCEICQGQFIIPDPRAIPERCIHCGSTMWLYGLRTNRGSLFIRKGMVKETKVLNKGVTSAKRQAWGKKQFRQFKPKPEGSPDQSGSHEPGT